MQIDYIRLLRAFLGITGQIDHGPDTAFWEVSIVARGNFDVLRASRKLSHRPPRGSLLCVGCWSRRKEMRRTRITAGTNQG